MTKIAIAVIKIYQYFSKTLIQSQAVPFLIPSSCRFYPSCSEYAIESLKKYGFFVGLYMMTVRILKCNPLSQIKADLP